VFADRLVNDEDRTWFSNLLSERMTADFKQSFDTVVTNDPLLYADFMSMSTDSRLYVEVSDHAKVRLSVPANRLLQKISAWSVLKQFSKDIALLHDNYMGYSTVLQLAETRHINCSSTIVVLMCENIFSERIIGVWNSLPPSIVSFESLSSFRNSLGNVNLGIYTKY